MDKQQIKNFSDSALISSLENHFDAERKTTHIILLHLNEILIRKLYADRGYADMFTMLIKHFKQSETAANQRLKALQLMDHVPEIEDKLKAGEVNLSTLAMAQRQILREEKVTGQKISILKKTEIVERISSKTMPEAEQELMTLLPESAKTLKTQERRISKDETRLSISFPNRVKEKMQKFKNHVAHANPAMDHVEIIERALDIALSVVDPIKKSKRTTAAVRNRSSVAQAGKTRIHSSDKADEANNELIVSSSKLVEMQNDYPIFSVNSADKKPIGYSSKPHKRPTYYSIKTDGILWERANSQCEYTDHITNKRCDSHFALERDHIIPLALGGSNEISNLRLLCRTHNQLLARQHFGAEKIQREINKNQQKEQT